MVTKRQFGREPNVVGLPPTGQKNVVLIRVRKGQRRPQMSFCSSRFFPSSSLVFQRG